MEQTDYTGIGPKNYSRSDERIREEVCEVLTHNPWVDASDIKVSVENGYLYLRGKVTSREQKKEAERCTEHLAGVKDVINYLTLRQDLGLIGDMSIKANML